MNSIKTRRIYLLMSYVCGLVVFQMSSIFQRMAYWGNTLVWYWVGISLTYLIWLVGVIFLVVSFKQGKNIKILGFISGVILVLGFLWATFIIIAGLSCI